MLQLQNSVITAVLLVVVIMLMVLGGRASLFIGIAIPASLAGIRPHLAGSPSTSWSCSPHPGGRDARRRRDHRFGIRRAPHGRGVEPRQAYSLAAKRMAGPVIAATATRIAAFSPLLFWPGIVGEFMKYMPLTSSPPCRPRSLLPCSSPRRSAPCSAAPAMTTSRRDNKRRDRGLYMRTSLALIHPVIALGMTLLLLVAVIMPMGNSATGRVFPHIEPDFGLVQVRPAATCRSTKRTSSFTLSSSGPPQKEIATVYARSGEGQRVRTRSPRIPSALSS
jgi:multidrug efflux pump